MSNRIFSGMGMGTGEIPTTDNIPDNRFFKKLNLNKTN